MAFDPDAYLAQEDKKKGFDPDAYLAQTQPTTTARKEQGKALVSLADTALNAITGGLDMAAYPLARAYYGTVGGLSPEQAAARAQAETTSPKDMLGRAFGYAGQPSYESSPLRQLGAYAGETLGENVITPAAQYSGLPEPDVANMVNWGTVGLAPAVPKVVRPVARNVAEVGGGLGSIAMSPLETAKGIVGGFGNSTKKPGVAAQPWETASARMPIGESYIPAPVLEAYRAGQISADQARAAMRPTTELPLEALKRTQGLVPFVGQEARAAGEHFGAGYRDPYKAAAEVGLDVLTAGGIPTVARLGSKAWDLGKTAQAYKQLGQAGFSPLTPAEAAALRTQAPIAGPVVPSAPPATLQSLRQPPKPAPAPAPTPAATAQQAAAAKVAPPATPVQAAAQETVAQRAQQAFGENYRAPVAQESAPLAGPVVPEDIFQTAPATKFENVSGLTPELEAKAKAEFADLLKASPTETIEVAGKTYTKKNEALTPKEQIADSIKATYRSQGQSINTKHINDTLDALGLPAVDFSKLPADYKSMPVKDARRAINKYVQTEVGLAGEGSRGPTLQTQIKEANANIAWENATKSAEELAKDAANAKTQMERMNKMRNMGSRFEMMTDESKVPSTMEMSTGAKETFKDKNLAIDEAIANKLSKNTHDISYRMPGGLINREIKTPGRLEIVQTDKNGLEVSYITEGTGDAKQYIRRTIDRDGEVLKSETFAEKPTNWQRGLLDALPEPTTTKADFLQDKMIADLSGETLNAVYKDGSTTVVVKPLEMFKTLTAEQKKQYLANNGLTTVSQRLDPAGKIDYKNMDKQLKQIQAAINKLD